MILSQIYKRRKKIRKFIAAIGKYVNTAFALKTLPLVEKSHHEENLAMRAFFSFLFSVGLARDPAISPTYTGTIWPKPQFLDTRSDVYTIDTGNIKFIPQV